MSLKDCIARAVAGGELDPERAAKAAELYDQLEAQYQGHSNQFEAARRAADDTIKALRFEATEKKRQAMLQAVTARRIDADMATYRNARAEEDPAAAVLAHLDRNELAGFSNVEARRKAVLGLLHGRMTDVLATFRRNLAGGVRHKAMLREVVREIFGEDSGNANAKELAKAWGAASEYGRQRFNAGGGRIPKRTDWGLPQSHDTLAVRQSTYKDWRDFILPKLDRTKMTDEITGLPLHAARLELALREAYEAIATDGFSRLEPSGQALGKKLANRHADHRFFAFRNADDWMAYQEKFGKASAFDAMVGHLDRMARDIAMIEVMGPNPVATLRWMGQKAEKHAAQLDATGGTTKHMDRARTKLKTADDVFAMLTGQANAPIHSGVARSFAGVRSVLQSAQLGAAAISAISDLGFQRIAAKHMGLSQFKVLGEVVKMFTPHVTANQKQAVRAGLIAENWATVASGQARFVGDVTGPEISRRFADFVMRASWLSPWTQAGRWAFGMEAMGLIADEAGKRFADLAPELQRTLRRYRIGEQAWDIIRATELYEFEGTIGKTTLLRPDDIEARSDLAPGLARDLTNRVLEMVQTETEFAVPSTSLRGRAAIVSDLQPGTIPGELVRSVAMYKNFAVTLVTTHIARVLHQDGVAGKGAMAVDLALTTMIMGALATQLKELKSGRDPRPMDTPEFWSAAVLQGGGLGIFGDFLFSDLNRFDRGLPETVAGPVIGFANDVRRLTLGNLAQLPGEDPTNFGRELIGFLRRYTPGGSLWYARLAYERLLLERMQRLVDPQAHRAFRRTQRRAAKIFNQGYWWRPGHTAPDRAPDLSNALGD